MGVITCCVPGCTSKTGVSSKEISFHRFPKDPNRSSVWIENCGREKLSKFSTEYLYKNFFVCSLHFTNSMFAGMFQNNRLKKSAIPTVFDQQIEITVISLANCIEDLDELLSSVTPEKVKAYNVVLPEKTVFSNLSVDTTDYVNLDFKKKNILSYISGYLIKKCLGKHSCEICEVYSKEEKNLSQENMFMYFKAYENANRDTFGNLKSPPKDFIVYIHCLEQSFCKVFPIMAIQNNVGTNIKNQIGDFYLDHPCDQFPKDYLLSLYIRLRIFYSLKFLNRDISESKNVKNYKLINVQNL